MTGNVHRAVLGVVALLLLPALASAQYDSDLVGFNGPPIDDPATCQEMFRVPQYSGTTAENIVANPTDPNDPDYPFGMNAAFRAAGMQTEGAAALEVYFNWIDAADPNLWVRLTTVNGAEYPNPALHIDGKVRFNLFNKSELWFGQIGVCIGVRETGELVGQLDDGGYSGDIEWIGVNTTPNGIIAGADGIVDTTAAGDDIQVYPVGYDLNNDPEEPLPTGTAVILPGPNGVINTTPAGDDQIRFGYFMSATGTRVPIPAITLAPGGSAYSLEWDLQTGRVSVNGGTPVGGITGFTGDGILDITPRRGTLEHIAITNVVTDPAVGIDIGIDALQFESPELDPVLPPRIIEPIIRDDTSVTVTDLISSVDRVSLYENDALVQTLTVSDPNDVVFTIAPAVAGHVFTATQRDGLSQEWSDPSVAVEVLPEASPFTLAIALDDDGDDCELTCEFLPVSTVDSTASGPAPRGVNLFTNSGVWQEIDLPLTDPMKVIAWLGGTGAVDPSPTGKYQIDSIWFTMATGADFAGPYEVFIDAVEALDEFGEVIATIHDMEDGINYMLHERGQSSTTPSSSALSDAASYDGTTSHRLLWTWPALDVNQTLGMYNSIQYACGTSPRFPDTTATVRFHVLCRQPSDNPVPLPSITAPIIVGDQDTVRITNSAAATAVQLYINGDPVGSPITPSGETTDVSGLTLMPGDSVSATQTLPEGESDLAYPRGVMAAPLAPTVVSPISPGVMSVDVAGLLTAPFATASSVTVYVNGAVHGTAAPSGATASVPLDITLATGDLVVATQTVNGEVSALSVEVTVAFEPPIFYVAPAEGATQVLLMGLTDGVDTVRVVKNEMTEFTASVPAGSDRVYVNVGGLAAGDSLVAYQAQGQIESVGSTPEIVTVNTITSVLTDSFEYQEADYAAAWADSTGVRLELFTGLSSTYPSGQKSLFAPVGTSRVQKDIAYTTGTATEPVVWNVFIFDSYGAGAANVQFAQLNAQRSDTYYEHVGMLSWTPQDTNYYQFRSVYHGGPNWLDLNELDAPVRSIGWHLFTTVHKGALVDVYVDGKLCVKNIELSSAVQFDRARIGAGYVSTNAAYYDDYTIETGRVRFLQLGPQPPLPPTIVSPIVAGDETVTVEDVLQDVTSVTIRDDSLAVIGTYTGPIDESGVVEVPLTRPLEWQEVIFARSANSVGTADSDTLEVGNGNGDILICLGIRETGDTGPLGTPGGTSGSLEWIGADGAIDGAPQGVAISPSDSWQTLVFDPTTAPITGFTGDGTLDVNRGVLEHLAVAVNSASADRSTGPYTLYVDNVVNVGAGAGGSDFVICDFEGYDLDLEVLLNDPIYSGSTGGDMSYPPSFSGVTDEFGNPSQSEYLTWFWVDTTAQRWARIVTSAVDAVPSPIVDLTKPIRLDVLLVASTGPQLCAGDMNCDGVVNYSDIDPFVAALTCIGGDPGCWPPAGFPADCPWLNGDCNGDGNVTYADIDPFVGRIGATCP